MNTPFWISHILSDVERGISIGWMGHACMGCGGARVGDCYGRGSQPIVPCCVCRVNESITGLDYF